MIESFATTSKRKESVIGQSILRTFLLVCIECTYTRQAFGYRRQYINDSKIVCIYKFLFEHHQLFTIPTSKSFSPQ